MSLRIGLYDFFAYTIPGIIIMFEILYIFNCFQEVNFQLLFKLNFSQIIIFGIIAYIIGHLFGHLSSKFFKIIFNREKIQKKAFDDIVKEYSDINVNFKSNQIPTLCAIIQNENPDQIIFIQWIDSLSIILRLISLAFIMLSIFEIFYFLYCHFKFVHLIFSVLAFLFFLISLSRSKVFFIGNAKLYIVRLLVLSINQ